MVKSRWRAHAELLIQSVLAARPDASHREARAALSVAYPFGEKAGHPYKIWRDAVRKALAARYPEPPADEPEELSLTP